MSLPQVAVETVPVLEDLAAEPARHWSLHAVEGLEVPPEDPAHHQVSADGALDAAALLLASPAAWMLLHELSA